LRKYAERNMALCPVQSAGRAVDMMRLLTHHKHEVANAQ